MGKKASNPPPPLRPADKLDMVTNGRGANPKPPKNLRPSPPPNPPPPASPPVSKKED